MQISLLTNDLSAGRGCSKEMNLWRTKHHLQCKCIHVYAYIEISTENQFWAFINYFMISVHVCTDVDCPCSCLWPEYSREKSFQETINNWISCWVVLQLYLLLITSPLTGNSINKPKANIPKGLNHCWVRTTAKFFWS